MEGLLEEVVDDGATTWVLPTCAASTAAAPILRVCVARLRGRVVLLLYRGEPGGRVVVLLRVRRGGAVLVGMGAGVLLLLLLLLMLLLGHSRVLVVVRLLRMPEGWVGGWRGRRGDVGAVVVLPPPGLGLGSLGGKGRGGGANQTVPVHDSHTHGWGVGQHAGGRAGHFTSCWWGWACCCMGVCLSRAPRSACLGTVFKSRGAL